MAGPRLPETHIDQVKTTAVLAFSNLLFDACVNTRSMNSRYPVGKATVAQISFHYILMELEKYVAKLSDNQISFW